MKSLNLMKQIDDALFQNLEKIKGSDQFQEFMENYNNWEDTTQEAFKTAMTAVIVIIPIFITFIIFIINSSTQSDFETKQEILKMINKISHQNSSVKNLSGKYFGSALASESAFTSQIKSSLTSLNIEPTKVTIANYNSDEEKGISKASAEVRFKDITSQNLLGLLSTITINKKMRIEEIDITKNQQSNLLGGSMIVFHYSKMLSVDTPNE